MHILLDPEVRMQDGDEYFDRKWKRVRYQLGREVKHWIVRRKIHGKAWTCEQCLFEDEKPCVLIAESTETPDTCPWNSRRPDWEGM